MAETILASVRKGNMTVAVFYGHPGVFVTPSHRAIYIARQEGYKAKMLPGVSAEDCLYADLDIDPASSGCSMYEASFLLLEPDRLDSRHHLIIWQVGCVGKEAMVFDNKELYKVCVVSCSRRASRPLMICIAGRLSRGGVRPQAPGHCLLGRYSTFQRLQDGPHDCKMLQKYQ